VQSHLAESHRRKVALAFPSLPAISLSPSSSSSSSSSSLLLVAPRRASSSLVAVPWQSRSPPSPGSVAGSVAARAPPSSQSLPPPRHPHPRSTASRPRRSAFAHSLTIRSCHRQHADWIHPKRTLPDTFARLASSFNQRFPILSIWLSTSLKSLLAHARLLSFGGAKLVCPTRRAAIGCSLRAQSLTRPASHQRAPHPETTPASHRATPSSSRSASSPRSPARSAPAYNNPPAARARSLALLTAVDPPRPILSGHINPLLTTTSSSFLRPTQSDPSPHQPPPPSNPSLDSHSRLCTPACHTCSPRAQLSRHWLLPSGFSTWIPDLAPFHCQPLTRSACP
jgi:hypothetical protein